MLNKKLMLGDNPFFGVDNLSQERSRNRTQIMKKFDKITEIIQNASSLGIKDFVVSTHPELRDLIKYMKENNTDLLKKFEFYPILPYAQGYVTKAAEKGVVNGMNEILAGSSIQNKFKILMQGSIGLIKQDTKKLLQTFIDVELLPLLEIKKNTIFLHDGLTDLSLGLKMKSVFETFTEQIEDKYDCNVGLVTKNFPKLVDTFEEWDMKIPTIMTSFNPIGYQMNPSKEKCEKYVNKTKVIAMNVLAAGYITPTQSFEYLSGLDISSVVIGMSTKEHVSETISEFKKY